MGQLDVGIYSTGTAEYFRTVQASVFAWGIGNAGLFRMRPSAGRPMVYSQRILTESPPA